MNQFFPKVSIIIPVYNGEKYIKNSIESALNQSYTNIEIVVVDDGSTDNTRKIVEEYKEKVKYFHKENGGVSSALNFGIEKMTGEYFSWLSHDDEYYPNKIEREVATLALLEDKETIICSNYDFMSENGNVYAHKDINHSKVTKYPELLLLEGFINGITLLIHKNIFKKYGKFDETLFCTQDYAKWLELIKKCNFYHICDYLTKTRIHSEQTSNISNKVLPEGVKTWKKIIESFPESRLVEIYGSLDLFYDEMLKFFKNSPYDEMISYIVEKKYNLNKYKPLVSIIIPVYNGENYLSQAIESALSQTYKNIEIIVVDDGSSDDTANIASDYGEKIKYYKKSNGGVASALNYGIEKAKGEYISWLSHDDEYFDYKLEKQVRLLNEIDNKDVVLFSNFALFDSDSKIFAHTNYQKRYTKKNLENGIFAVLKGTVNGCSMLIPKKLLLNEGLFPEKKKTSNDYIMWFKLFSKYPCYFMEDELVKYRIHDKQDTRVSPVYNQENDDLWYQVFNNLEPETIEKLGFNLLDFYYEAYNQFLPEKIDKTLTLLNNKIEQLRNIEPPKVSILMPCYNSSDYVSKTIESILSQSYGNFELICIDDSSTDDTYNILKKYAKKDSRIKVQKNKYKKGISGALNTGLDLARGEYITRQDSDDISLTDRIRMQYYFLKENPEYGLCTVDASYIDKNDEIINQSLYNDRNAPFEYLFLYCNPIISCPCMFRKCIINGLKFDEGLDTAEDYAFFTELVKNNNFYVIKEPLYLYRKHEDSTFNKNFDKTLINSLAISLNYYKLITKNKIIPEYFAFLTEFSVDKKPLEYFEKEEVFVFLLKTLESFSKYYNWNSEDFENAYNYTKKLYRQLFEKNTTPVLSPKKMNIFEKVIYEIKHNGLKYTVSKIIKRIFL